MFLGLAALLFIAWILGFGVFHVAGGLIHLILIIAIVSLVWHFISGRRSVT